MITKDRVVNVLGVSGAIFCLVMILAGPGQAEEDNGAPAPPATSHVAPAPTATVPGAPVRSQPVAPPARQPAADGDDDG